MYPSWRSFCGILTLTASLVTLGCGNSGNSNARVVNASPGLSNFTVIAGVETIASSLPYGTVGIQPKDQYTDDSSGNYLVFGAGTNQPASIYGANLQSGPISTTKQTFLKNGYYTLVTLGTAPGVHLQILTDSNVTPPSGEYQLRFMDASPQAGAIDVYITAPGGSVVGATPVIGNINFQGVVTNPQPSPGTLEIQVTPHGNQSHVLAIQPFSPAGGKDYSVFFLDPPNTGSIAFGILVVNDPITTTTTMSSGT